jgi:hypothetical protein
MTTEQLLILVGAVYLGIGAICASRWFHHRNLISVVLVILFWPVIWVLSLFTK